MKKFNLFIAFAFWTIVAAGLCVGCGHLLAGTAEEPNEMTADCDKDCESKSSSSSSEPSGLSSVVEDPSPSFNDFSLDYYLAGSTAPSRLHRLLNLGNRLRLVLIRNSTARAPIGLTRAISKSWKRTSRMRPWNMPAWPIPSGRASRAVIADCT